MGFLLMSVGRVLYMIRVGHIRRNFAHSSAPPLFLYSCAIPLFSARLVVFLLGVIGLIW